MVKEYCDYHGEHSALIGDKDTFEDWHLVPTGGYLFFVPPSVSLSFVDNPAGDGLLDFTDALTGFPVIGGREGQWDFTVLNGHQYWRDSYSSIMNYLHGRRFRVVLKDDPEYYYMARFTVDQWQSEEARSTITLKYTADPYKLSVYTSIEDQWKWDPFNFETGIILPSKCRNIAISPTDPPTITLSGKDVGRRPVVPKLKYVGVDGDSTLLKFKFSNTELGISNVTKTIQKGDTLEDVDIVMSGYSEINVNKFVVTEGFGTLSIVFRRGSL